MYNVKGKIDKSVVDLCQHHMVDIIITYMSEKVLFSAEKLEHLFIKYKTSIFYQRIHT